MKLECQQKYRILTAVLEVSNVRSPKLLVHTCFALLAADMDREEEGPSLA